MTTYCIAIWDGTSIYQVAVSGNSLAHALRLHLQAHGILRFNSYVKFTTPEEIIQWLDAGITRATAVKVGQTVSGVPIVPTATEPLVCISSITSEVIHQHTLPGMFGLTGA